jgi:hypothetical protein
LPVTWREVHLKKSAGFSHFADDAATTRWRSTVEQAAKRGAFPVEAVGIANQRANTWPLMNYLRILSRMFCGNETMEWIDSVTK